MGGGWQDGWLRPAFVDIFIVSIDPVRAPWYYERMSKLPHGIEAYRKEAGKGAAGRPPAAASKAASNGDPKKKGAGRDAAKRPAAGPAPNSIKAASGGRQAASGGRQASAREKVPPIPEPASGSPLEGLLKVQKGGGVRKAAKLLLLLGKDQAVKVVQHLSPDEIEDLSREIARIKRIERVEAVKLLDEFGVLAKTVREPRGGLETARELLVAAFGEERGTELLKRAVPIEGERPFAFMDDLEDQQIILLLKDEPPPVQSVILRFLDPRKASAVVSFLSPDVRKEVLLRMARMDRIDPLVFSKMEEVLKERLRTQGTIVTEQIDGATALADILKHMDLAAEERILKEMSDADAVLSEQVKEKLFTIDVIFSIDDTDLQDILRDYSDQEIAVLIKGKPDPVRERFLSCVSQRRRDFIVEESAHLGSMKRSEVDKITKDFLDYLWKMESEKRLVIHRENEYFI